MIGESISALVTALSEQTDDLFRSYPELRLDGTLPSVGTLDCLTYHMRSGFGPGDEALLHSAAAYLGLLAYYTWRQFPDELHLELDLITQPAPEVQLRASRGRHLSGTDRFVIPISSALRQIITAPQAPLPVFERFVRQIPPNHNRLSLFAVGLCSGLCPYGKGPWKHLTLNQYLDYGASAGRSLAESAATFYRRIHPHENLGGKFELYESGLVFPPSGFREPQLGSRVTAEVLIYLKKHIEEEDSMRDLALNLLLSPDEMISSTGFILSVAHAADERAVPSAVKAFAEAHPTFVPALRFATIFARHALDRPSDWMSCIETGQFDEALTLIEVERRSGLLPLLRLPIATQLRASLKKYGSELSKSPFYLFLVAIAWSRAEEARELCNVLHAIDPDDLEIVVQRAALDIACGEWKPAELVLDRALSLPLTGDMAGQAIYLRSTMALAQGDIPRARSLLERGTTLRFTDTRVMAFLSLTYAKLLLQVGKPDDALAQVNRSLTLEPVSLAAKILRHDLFTSLGREEEAKEERSMLGRLYPFDRRVFELLRL